MDENFTQDKRFTHALSVLLDNEGGYSNDPDDPGKETNFGITQNELNNCGEKLGLPLQVKNLTKDNAATYYRNMWWDKYNYNAIYSLEIATKIFNLAVNIGPDEAAIILQSALNWCGYRVTLDGIIGKETTDTVNEMCLHGREKDLRDEITDEAKHYYQRLTEENPKLYKYLKGWTKRAEE